MNIVKLALIGCLVFYGYKHRADIHWPSFSQAPEHRQEQIQDLEQQIACRKHVLSNLQNIKMPAVGSVVGKSKCGSNIVVCSADTAQRDAEVSKLQGEVDRLERELEELRQRSR